MLENNKKMCAFYASDYHFEMIILPYLNKKIEENNNIVIFTENNLKESVDILISRMNLKEERKEKILNLDWENDDLEKFNILKTYEKEPKETVVFVKGTENYIKNVNENINKTGNDANINVVDCYSVDEIKNNLMDVTCNYEYVLSTSGENKIN